MNKTITSITETTKSDKVRQLAAQLIAWSGKRVKATFVKKNGEIRTLICVPRNAWNALNGFQSTRAGVEMVRTKVARGMATVCEILDTGAFQPRTLNLNTVLAMELV